MAMASTNSQGQKPCQSTASSIQPSGDLASISVASRIPEFWTDMPRLWFAQFDAVMDPQKQGDSTKYNMVVAKLGREALQQVSDLIYSPPTDNKFMAIKERLLTTFEESSEKQFDKLVGEMELGSQRPSQLLRKMSALANNTQVSDEALRRLWIARLPTEVKTVLSVVQDMKLDDIAKLADKIMENMRTGEVAAVTSAVHTPDISDQLRQVTTELQTLRLEINEIRRRDTSRGRAWNRPRTRSQSRGVPRTPESPNWLCRFHYRWRGRARMCEQPCNWKKTASTEN